MNAESLGGRHLRTGTALEEQPIKEDHDFEEESIVCMRQRAS